ncbi:MAG: hypothetical protein IJ636_02430, partial [Bacteroidales bacterium]|nr:hypothetical protein [Bacteroidales bacterium]
MKKILKYSALAALCAMMSILSGCQPEGLDTAQFSDKNTALAAIAPNPVMRGGVLRIVGSNLESVSEIRFAGGVTVTSFETVSTGARSEL